MVNWVVLSGSWCSKTNKILIFLASRIRGFFLGNPTRRPLFLFSLPLSTCFLFFLCFETLIFLWDFLIPLQNTCFSSGQNKTDKLTPTLRTTTRGRTNKRRTWLSKGRLCPLDGFFFPSSPCLLVISHCVHRIDGFWSPRVRTRTLLVNWNSNWNSFVWLCRRITPSISFKKTQASLSFVKGFSFVSSRDSLLHNKRVTLFFAFTV